jgi:hypothetical protein
MGRDEISHYLVCWCRTADCEGRWPVLSRDADNNPARPYLCAETNDYVIFRGPNTIQARITEQSEGFAEPAWPRQPPPTG